MRSDVCRELIQHLDDGGLRCAHAPEKVQRWLESLELPMEFLRFMQWYWPQEDGQIAHLTILSSQSIFDDAYTAQLAGHGFLLIGYAPNGDWLVIDFGKRSCVPCFITHEEWREGRDPRAYCEPVARTLESLLWRAAEGRYIHTDYYAAKPFNDFLKEEEGRAQP